MGDHNSISENGDNPDIDTKNAFAASELFKSLFHEGMDLVKEVAAYLDGPGRIEAQGMPRDGNLLYTKASMLLTTRLMQMASWLLVHRAVGEGEITAQAARSGDNLVVVEAPDARLEELQADLPEGLRGLAQRCQALQERIARLDRAMIDDRQQPSAPDGLNSQLDQLRAAFSPGQPDGGTEET